VDNSGGIQASLAGRYATALFGLARDEKQIDAVTRSLESLEIAVSDSPEFRALVGSPLISRAEAAKAIRALIPTLGVDPITGNFLGVLADNGRLGELKAMIKAFRSLAARHRGETTAEVTSARPLDDDQVVKLKANLKARLGRDVAVEARVQVPTNVSLAIDDDRLTTPDGNTLVPPGSSSVTVTVIVDV